MYFQTQGLSRKSEMLTQFIAFPQLAPDVDRPSGRTVGITRRAHPNA
jgi:hypothetical protein